MKKKNDRQMENTAAGDAAPRPLSERFEFDATTNFSILGWILDRGRKTNGDRQQVDFDRD